MFAFDLINMGLFFCKMVLQLGNYFVGLSRIKTVIVFEL